MSTKIILHSTDDEKILLELEEYCRQENLTLEKEDIIIKTIATGLVSCTISGENLYEEEIPGYNLYSPLIFETEDSKLEQSALLALLSMFYNTNVKYTIKDLNKETYLEEGSQEEVVEEETNNPDLVSEAGSITKRKEESIKRDLEEGVNVEIQREEETLPPKEVEFVELIYLFNDGETPFYVETEKLSAYITVFKSMLGKKLVTVDPLFHSVLKVYLEPAIKQYQDYDLWYSDPRFDASRVLEKLDFLTKEGFFCVKNPSNITDEVIKLFNYEELSNIPPTVNEEILQTEEENLDASLVFNKDKNLSTNIRLLEGLNPLSLYYNKLTEKIPIRGPIVCGFRLDEDFFATCVTQAEKGRVPSVNVKVNFTCDRKTVAACILSSVDTMCGEMAGEEVCLNDRKKEFKCKKSTCNYFSCEMLEDICVYSLTLEEKSLDKEESNVGWISLTVGNYVTLKEVLEATQVNAKRITIVNVADIDEGLLYRFAFYRKGYKSLLLDDTKGYFVAVWDYWDIIPEIVEDVDGMEILEEFDETIENVNSLRKIVTGQADLDENIFVGKLSEPLSLTEEEPLSVYRKYIPAIELESLSSDLPGYLLYGKGYAHMGIYSVPNILPGLLENIPVPDFNAYKLSRWDLAKRTKDIIYAVFSENGRQITSIESNGENITREKVEADIKDIYNRYSTEYGNITVNSWEKNYISSLGVDPFSYCLGKECPYIEL